MQTNDELIKAARRDYHRKWRAENRDKVKAAQDRYWLKKAKNADSISSASETRANVESGNLQITDLV